MGLEFSFLSSSQNMCELRVDLSFDGNNYYAFYDTFGLSGPLTHYTLTVGGFEGTAGDELGYHDNMAFTTKDRDNDMHRSDNCAVERHGAWWYRHCVHSNLNGLWDDTSKEGLWRFIGKGQMKITLSQMKVRRKSCESPLYNVTCLSLT